MPSLGAWVLLFLPFQVPPDETWQFAGPGETRRFVLGGAMGEPKVIPADLVELNRIEEGIWEVTAKKPGNGLMQWGRAYKVLHKIQIGPASTSAAPSFLREVLPLLTRAGCNQGSCHGKGAGQNGFRLSLRGYAPDWDYAWLTREFMGRRIDKNDPSASPFLKKALGLAPHEGGRRIQPDSRAHQLLVRWIEAEMPGPNPKESPLAGLELRPNLRHLPVGESTGLLAYARYQDGTVQEVSWLCRFESNDPGLASISPHGWVTAARPGETTIRASFGTEVAVATIRTPFPPPATDVGASKTGATITPNHPLDLAMTRQWEQLGLPSSAICDDLTFVRRAHLDATCMLPTADQTKSFLADVRPKKREALIDQLLQTPAFVDRWTLFLADLLQNRKERDHDVRGIQGVRQFHSWLRGKVESDTSWDKLATEILTAKGSAETSPAIGYFIVTVGEHQDPTKSEAASSVAQAFLGTRIGCAQCHNHPLERYTQDDYYHFAGFFSRLKLDRKEPNQGVTQLIAVKPDTKPGAHQPRTGQFLAAQPLDRKPAAIGKDQDPREALAKWMSGPGRSELAGAMANRVWRELLGRGLVEPVDDLRATNPPVNPEAWKVLVDEFLKKDLQWKELIRFIMTSEVYQRSGSTNPQNASDRKFFSHYAVRRLSAEQLLDAVSSVTGIPESFPGYPRGLRAQQIPDPTFPSYFLKVFGRSERVTACACEREGEVTLPQMLHLRNNLDLQARIRHPQGRLGQALAAKKPPLEIAKEFHLIALGRPLESATEELLKKEWSAGAPVEEVLADFVWALLNSKDFAFNH